MDYLIQQLHKLKTVEPSATFAEKSRRLVLSVTPRPAVQWQSLVWAGAFSVVLIALVSFNTLYKSGASPVSLDVDRLNNELTTMNINIQLREISYQQNIDQAIASAMDEITQNQIRHLNKTILESEKNAIDLNEEKDSEIDQMLEKVLF